jgi:type IV secretion system protein VirB5
MAELDAALVIRSELRDDYREALAARRAEHQAFAKDKSLPELPPYLKELAPWLTGAVEYAERYGSLAQEARRWRLGFFAVSIALIVAVVALVAIATTAKVVPYVVQVDEHGYAVAIKPAEKAGGADERVVIASVARWVRAMRSVVGDRVAQQQLMDETFSMLPPKAASNQRTREFFEAHDPYRTDERVDVEVHRVAPMSERTLTVEWSERKRSRSGAAEYARFSAVVTISISPTRTLRDVMSNPLGVFVTDYSISQLQ